MVTSVMVVMVVKIATESKEHGGDEHEGRRCGGEEEIKLKEIFDRERERSAET